MAKTRPCICRNCHRTEMEAGGMSLSGLCADCGAQIQLETLHQIQAREGPYYERWLMGVAAAASKRITKLQRTLEDSS